MLGGLLLCIGHSVLAIEHMTAFYTGLGFIVLGVGCLKGNISSWLEAFIANFLMIRETWDFIFYMGINIGTATASIIVGYVGEEIGWHYGFGLAGIEWLLANYFIGEVKNI